MARRPSDDATPRSAPEVSADASPPEPPHPGGHGAGPRPSAFTGVSPPDAVATPGSAGSAAFGASSRRASHGESAAAVAPAPAPTSRPPPAAASGGAAPYVSTASGARGGGALLNEEGEEDAAAAPTGSPKCAMIALVVLTGVAAVFSLVGLFLDAVRVSLHASDTGAALYEWRLSYWGVEECNAFPSSGGWDHDGASNCTQRPLHAQPCRETGMSLEAIGPYAVIVFVALLLAVAHHGVELWRRRELFRHCALVLHCVANAMVLGVWCSIAYTAARASYNCRGLPHAVAGHLGPTTLGVGLGGAFGTNVFAWLLLAVATLVYVLRRYCGCCAGCCEPSEGYQTERCVRQRGRDGTMVARGLDEGAPGGGATAGFGAAHIARSHWCPFRRGSSFAPAEPLPAPPHPGAPQAAAGLPAARSAPAAMAHQPGLHVQPAAVLPGFASPLHPPARVVVQAIPVEPMQLPR